jgi:hypothetical protein
MSENFIAESMVSSSSLARRYLGRMRYFLPFQTYAQYQTSPSAKGIE